MSPAHAQSPQEVLRGKTVRIVVGQPAGGGFDTYARLLAPHLAQRLDATVIVDNRPGGGGQTATNQLVNEKPDGQTLFLINAVPAILGQLVAKPGVSYDLPEFTWLGRVSGEPWAILVNNDSSFKDFADLKKKDGPVLFSAASRVDGPSDAAAALCVSLQIECKIVLGFDGTNEASLAVARGEVDAIVMQDTSIADKVRSGQGRAIGVLGSKRSTIFPDLETVADLGGMDETGTFWNDYRASIGDVGRFIIAPPGMDAEMTSYLRGVWEDILTDPKVVEEGEKAQRFIDFLSGEEGEKLVDSIFLIGTSERASEIKEVLLDRYF